MVSPLNWGLGHASRCVPIIRELLAQGAEVIIGAEEYPLGLLKAEFPQLKSVELPGYNITYPSGGNMAIHMLKIMPKILSGIKDENRFIQELVETEELDGIISDNRFGLYSEKIPTVFMTHQVMVKSPLGESFIQKLNGRFMSKFSEVWIPDYEDEPNISGDLAHKYKAPKNAKFIGPLSRLQSLESQDKKFDVLAIISGPEPQRTLFQHIMQTELELANVKAAMVLGKAISTHQYVDENVTIFNHLPADELNQLIHQSEIVISRSGYSTLMDLAQINRKAILVPTPGQTEQEYLANWHAEQKHFFAVDQDRFDLDEALEHSKEYTGFSLPSDPELLSKTISDWMDTISK